MTESLWFSAVPRIQEELHFDDRRIRCFADRPRSVYALLSDAVARFPEGEALVDGDLRLRWHEVQGRADELASGLASAGLVPGDRAALVLGNSASFVTIIFALARMGVIAVPIGTRSSASEIAYMLENSGCCAVFCDSETVARLPDAALLPGVRLRVCLSQQPGCQALDEIALAGRGAAPVQAYAGSEEDAAYILYTSGTTGRPKGAILTSLGVVHSTMHYEACMGLGPADRSVISVPMSHVTGLVALVLTAVRCAMTLIVMAVFKAKQFLQLAERERMTHTLMVPAMYNLCLLQPDFSGPALKSWRLGAYGGAPMPPATIEALASKLGGLELMNAYGATETTSPATMTPPGSTASHTDTVGISVPCAEIIIADFDGTPLPTGTSGEIWIRGPMVVKGYWQNPTATAESFTDGFWHSGDIGTMDDSGFVRILDRIKDVINRGGYKVFSSEVEAVLASHPQVIESAVVGRPCPVLGERVHAFVVVRDGASADSLKMFCAERMSDYKVPETFTLSSEPLPRNANGKLLKRQMRDAATEAAQAVFEKHPVRPVENK
ncbi:O-succinylbenzoate--CoA ligase [Rhodoferax ferrireducens T118]|uniref:O-succinylbenzoate--CoA ligase n=1 Tax=Albidiferax ferrireducens (strain ATCC BAA-621 / DSM 15236 / T118) TaxID=338969 RepID=Q21ZP3_ALBFT|nr:class I adenylate-forming enzyme family protein [Rhodoferax ferrireducens]ABD68760.1 O-succinylbenzoate--CoA ligase [Rhodoferax ferrireducens T118]